MGPISSISSHIMKGFTHTPLTIPLPEISAETTDHGRFYTTPEGNVYPSVTTVLGTLSDKAIKGWRKRVGEDEAKRISEHAANRGTDLHSVLESYLKNETLPFPTDPASKVRIMFNRMKRPLTAVNNIIAQEIPLYSDVLQMAGRCDLIAEYNGVLSVIDFKSTTKAKKQEWITGYFLQTTAYSLMLEERTGLKAEQLVIMMSGEDDCSSQAFVDTRDKYRTKLTETIDLYNRAA